MINLKVTFLLVAINLLVTGCAIDLGNLTYEMRSNWYDTKFDYCEVDYRLCKLEGKLTITHCTSRRDKCIRQITKYYKEIQHGRN